MALIAFNCVFSLLITNKMSFPVRKQVRNMDDD